LESPSVSGAQNYRELCVVAKKEERRLAELKKKQQYLKTDKAMLETINRRSFQSNSGGSQKSGSNWSKLKSYGKQKSLCCCVCNSPHQMACDGHKNKTESQGKPSSQKTTQMPKGNKMIHTRYCMQS